MRVKRRVRYKQKNLLKNMTLFTQSQFVLNLLDFLTGGKNAILNYRSSCTISEISEKICALYFKASEFIQQLCMMNRLEH